MVGIWTKRTQMCWNLGTVMSFSYWWCEIPWNAEESLKWLKFMSQQMFLLFFFFCNCLFNELKGHISSGWGAALSSCYTPAVSDRPERPRETFRGVKMEYTPLQSLISVNQGMELERAQFQHCQIKEMTNEIYVNLRASLLNERCLFFFCRSLTCTCVGIILQGR